LRLLLSQYFRAIADPPIRKSQLSARLWRATQEASSLVWKKSRTWRNDNRLLSGYAREKTIRNWCFVFAQGFTWFGYSSPGGIFTLQPLNIEGAFLRAEIVIGAIVATYGMLLWRSTSRKLSLANYIIGLPCVAVLLPCVSKLSEWVYFILGSVKRRPSGRRYKDPLYITSVFSVARYIA
jgi:hypothetical protein